MMKYLTIGMLLIVAGCSSLPERSHPALRGDVLYFENNAFGRKAAQEATKFFGGKQEIVIVDFELSKTKHSEPISRPLPLYPLELARKGADGTVTVEYIVDETGHVFDAVVVETTDPAFNAEALNAVRKWTFKPASRDGINIRERLLTPIEFSLK